MSKGDMEFVICTNNEILKSLFDIDHDKWNFYENDICKHFTESLLNTFFNTINHYFDYTFMSNFSYWNGGPGYKDSCNGIVKYINPPENFNEDLIYDCISKSIDNTNKFIKKLT